MLMSVTNSMKYIYFSEDDKTDAHVVNISPTFYVIITVLTPAHHSIQSYAT
jgi:hypothetical protein